MPSPARFPTRTALAFATTMALLAAARLLDRTKGLSPAIFLEAAHVDLMRHGPAHHSASNAPLNSIQQPETHSTSTPIQSNPCTTNGLAPGASEVVSPPGTRRASVSLYLIDDCGSLDSFFTALHHLETPGMEGPQIVSVLHYGDSPTTADLITGDIRDLLQQRFGDAGRGYLLTARPWAWYGHRGVDISDHNWNISTAVGKGRPETYGIGGASFEGGASSSTHLTLQNPNQTSLDLSFLGQPNGGSLAVSADNTLIETVSTASEIIRPMWQTIALPPNTRTIDLKPTSGTVRLFGETLLTGHRGVLYNSLGLNGASTSVLSNGFNAAAWSSELMHDHPHLVVINYGTNESGFGSYVDRQYEPTLRIAIARIRTALPAVPILVMSPMDRGRRSGVDGIETYDTIPRIVAIQRRVAADLNCAFFDTFNAMGGDGTMSRWYTGHPRLVAGDLIHPTPQGASLVANLFVQDLSRAYDQFLGVKPQPLSPAGDAPAAKPAIIKSTASAAHKPPLSKPSAAGEPLPIPSPPIPPSSQPLPAQDQP